MKTTAFAIAFAAILLGGCAATAGGAKKKSAAEPAPTYVEVEREVSRCTEGEAAFDCDRRAILAMVGDFKVSFRFDETVVLAPGYDRRDDQRSGGFETVVVIEDSGGRIDLQHILVVMGHVVKHWRQTWVYQADPIWRFEGAQTYRIADRADALAPGTWTQFVHEVSDAPRYAGSGRWDHSHGVSTWTSDRTWRPLPRREYTKRDDYQLLDVINRHTITPQGWTHEQDNIKVRRDDGGVDRQIVREFGFNDYRRIRGYDFSPGTDYWKKTGAFWTAVRQRWAARLAHDGLTLGYRTDDEKFIGSIFEAAEAYAEDRDLSRATATVDALFAASVLAPGATQAGSTADGFEAQNGSY
jgi:hypothetical protein